MAPEGHIDLPNLSVTIRKNSRPGSPLSAGFFFGLIFYLCKIL